MARNKNQHFVPRCLLRNFGADGCADPSNEKCINLYNLKSQNVIERAPIKNQCSRSYFYGKNLQLENALQKMEGEFSRIVRQLAAFPERVEHSELAFLRDFAYLQMSRTSSAVAKSTYAFEKMDELSFSGFDRKDYPEIKTDHESMLLQSMCTWGQSRYVVEDLQIMLVKNETKNDFVISDHPTFLINRLYSQSLKRKHFGLASAGVQLGMPLTSRVALICYDRASYGCKNKKGFWLTLTSETDVGVFNELQYMNADENIYLRTVPRSDDFRSAVERARLKRPDSPHAFWQGVLEEANPAVERFRRLVEGEEFGRRNRLISISSNYPIPSKWISVLPLRQNIFAYSNGSAVGYIRAGQLGRLPVGNNLERVDVKSHARGGLHWVRPQ